MSLLRFINRKSPLAALSLAAVLAVTACSGGNNAPTPSPAPESSTGNVSSNQQSTELPEVNLVWYTIGSPQADQQKVTDKINAYLKEKINATLEIRTLDWGDYEPKMNAIMAARESFDLAFATRAWVLPYQSNVDKGAFLPVGELIDAYASEARASIPDKFWPDLEANDGQVYMFPNYQIAARKKGFIVRKDLVDKYGFDLSAVKTYKDMEPFFETLKTSEPDVIPYGTGGNQDKFFSSPSFARVPADTVVYKKDDPTYTVLGLDEELQDGPTVEYYETLHAWYEKKYINQDAPTLKDFDQKLKQGNIFAMADTVMKPGGEAAFKEKSGHEGVYVPLEETPIFTGIKDAGTIVSATSKNPERAMMLINLVNTDPYLYNLLCFGIEGEHYTKNGNYAVPVADAKYNPNTDWVFGNQFNGLLREGQPEDVWEQTKQLNESAEVPAIYGFSFNSDSVKTEAANIAAITQEFDLSLRTGIVEPSEIIPKYIAKLRDAGMATVTAEKQRQLDAFLQEKGLK